MSEALDGGRGGETPGIGLDVVTKALEDNTGQAAFLRQQVGQLHTAVTQLYGAVQAQCVQLRDSDQALLQELQRFQTGGPQRAMAGVYVKLFRDLLRHMNQLDDMVALASGPGALDPAWSNALRVERDHLEKILKDWGCQPMNIRIGEDEFDPERHEAAPEEVGVDSASHRIAAVRRRGWLLADTVLQHPLVVTG